MRSGGAEVAQHLAVEVFDALASERSAASEPFSQYEWVTHANSRYVERLVEQAPVGVDETQHRHDAYLDIEGVAHDVSLSVHLLDHLRLRQATDVECRRTASHPILDQLVLVPLGVDDVHTTWSNRDVIDVGRATGYPAIVYDPDGSPGGKRVKHAADPAFAVGTLPPRGLVTRCVGERHAQSAGQRVSVAGAAIPVRVSSFAFALCGRAGDRNLRMTGTTFDDAAVGVPPREVSDSKGVIAHRALTVAPKRQMTTLPHCEEIGDPTDLLERAKRVSASRLA